MRKTASQIADYVLRKVAKKDTRTQEEIEFDERVGYRHPETRSKRKLHKWMDRLIEHSGGDPSQFEYVPEFEELGPAYRVPLPMVGAAQRMFPSLQEKAEGTIFQQPESKLISINPGRFPTVVGHEVGHAVPTTPGHKFLQKAQDYGGGFTGFLLPPALVLGGHFLKKPWMKYTGYGLGGLAGAATLGGEWSASQQAKQNLRALGYEPTDEEITNLRKNLATYIPDAAQTAVFPTMLGLALPG